MDDRTPREIIAKFRTGTGEEFGDERAGDLLRWLEDAGLVILSRDDLQRLTRLGGQFAQAIAASRIQNQGESHSEGESAVSDGLVPAPNSPRRPE
jgi:hypothetical protein